MALSEGVLKLKATGYDLEGEIRFAKFDKPVPLVIEGVTTLEELAETQQDALESFLGWDEAVFEQLEQASFAYFQEVKGVIGGETHEDFPIVKQAREIWRSIDPICVELDQDSSAEHHYIRVECRCAWEEEHGLEWVVRDAKEVLWVGACERHMVANIEAGMTYNYADPEAKGFNS